MKWTPLLLGLLASAYEKPALAGFQNPAGISSARGYSHVAAVTGETTNYIAGQVSLDKDGNLIGKGDVRAQMFRCTKTWALVQKHRVLNSTTCTK
jgi:enamine deaminase RidA (YjgF/YER057c/UK114 family)